MQYIAKKFFEAKSTYDINAIIQNLMQDRLLSLLPKKRFYSVLEIGCGTGGLTRKLFQALDFTKFVCNDINDYKSYIPPQTDFILLDANSIHTALEEKFDLIISNACIQWLHQREFLANILKLCHQDSLLVFGTFGKQNLIEIRQHTNNGLDYLDLIDYEKILSENYHILHLSETLVPLTFQTPLEVFRHLKLTGVNSLESNYTITQKKLYEFQTRFNNTLTYHPIYITIKPI
ncbi:biotin biosynthesis protein BioC [Helicobacter anseris]|uniref:Biotin biosynthesis protein BioC n=1 Tax=Helicobacter anseris TaxID=375926 RepID=A0A3D8JA62_9HELI|nr:methyltransferase [Helicobacter anseris]RDU74359.1 biotin biosynthesis protein BioC [Helicobacter anseris]